MTKHKSNVFPIMSALGCLLLFSAPGAGQQPAQLTNTIGLKLIRLQAGTFLYGGKKETSRPNLWQPRFQLQVTLSRDYYLGAQEVTQAQFEKVMGENPSAFRDPKRPVDSVTFHEAVAFCRKLSEHPAEQAAGRVYRLPTSAEWEYACRAGSVDIFPWGDEDETKLGDYAWCRDWYGPRAAGTQPVGGKQPNSWGFYDMLGNVWEWCSDSTWFDPMQALTYSYRRDGWTDPAFPVDPTAKKHILVIRGGGWKSDFRSANCFMVTGQKPLYRDNDTGFRVVCVVGDAGQTESGKSHDETVASVPPVKRSVDSAHLLDFNQDIAGCTTLAADKQLTFVNFDRDSGKDGSGCLRVEMRDLPADATPWTTGAAVQFRDPYVDAGSSVAITFDAKSIDAPAVLGVFRPWGGDREVVPITPQWDEYTVVYKPLKFVTNSLLFNLVEDLDNHRIKDGVFLIDNLRVTISASGGFTDKTAKLALKTADTGWDGTGLGTSSAAVVDMNNDGRLDISTVCCTYANNVDTFEPTSHFFSASIWGDFNNDGRLDLFSPSQGKLYRNDSYPSFSELSLPPMPTVCLAACFADFNNDGQLDLYVSGYEADTGAPAMADVLLMGSRNDTFSEAWRQKTAHPARGVTACDFDEDGDMDVYVSNYRLRPNNLWLNEGTPVLTDVADTYGAAGANGHTIGSCWGDLDNDGHFDLFVGNFAHPGQPQSQFLRNRGPDGNWHFEDKSAVAKLGYQESFANPNFGDYDNDGDLDLFITTVYGTASGGIQNRAVLLRNDGNFTFTDVTSAQGLAGIGAGNGNYLNTWADIDDDGDLDLFTDMRVFVNGGNAFHWLQVTLEGDGNRINRSAVGAQVRIAMDRKIITRQVESGTGAGTQNPLRLHFGLGPHDGPVDLEIRWPDNFTQTVAGVAVDQMLKIVYREAKPNR